MFHGSTARSSSILTVLGNASRETHSVDIAVSYVQYGGLALFFEKTRIKPGKHCRLLLTDQFDFTHPDALQYAIDHKIQIRCYRGKRTFHPKVYLYHIGRGAPASAVIGSANLSESALLHGIEAVLRTDDARNLSHIAKWYESLWSDRTNARVDEAFVRRYRNRWEQAAKLRAEARRKLRRLNEGTDDTRASDLVIADDLFAKLQVPIVTLNLDQTGNTVRTLGLLLECLQDFSSLDTKKQGELRHLGLAEGDTLTGMGTEMRKSDDIQTLANGFCKWLATTPIPVLEMVNYRLVRLRRSMKEFWKLPEDIRDYFFTNYSRRKSRGMVQAIEMSCSLSTPSSHMTMEDVQILATAEVSTESVDAEICTAVQEYRRNKGSRGWNLDDRRILLQAWRAATT